MRARTIARSAAILAALLGAGLPAAAIQSHSFRLDEYVFSAGGHPQTDGTILTSAGGSFEMRLDAIGDAFVDSLGSVQYSMDAGFVGLFPPPGEVLNLRFSDTVTLRWSPEKSVGVYNLYRDFVSELPMGGYGQCSQQNLPSATATDTDVSAAGTGFFYLVTAENRLAEHGTKGFASYGVERIGNICP